MKNKKLIIAIAMCAAGALATGARANALSPYLSVKAGYGTANIEKADTSYTGTGFIGAVGAQYALKDINLRGELEISMLNYKDDHHNQDNYPIESITGEAKLKDTSYMANFYVDFFKNYKLKPYVGFGLGSAKFKEDISEEIYDYSTTLTAYDSYSSDKSAFIYGLHLGVGFNITDGLGSEIGARYLVADIDGKSFLMLSANIGLRYTF
jgi:opacity protein-like surface antigen